MWLPTSFCGTYLPKKNSVVLLETESGKKSQAVYECKYKVLSSGWKRFAVSNNLLARDVLVFRLVMATKFKVYIIRTNDLKKRISGASASSDTPRRSSGSITLDVTRKSKGDPVLPLPLKAFRGRPRHHTGDIDEATELRLDHRAWDSGLNFQDFHTFMIELLNECQLPENIQRTYYELCHSHDMFLHGHHLVKNINPYLTAGAIVETVRIVEAIGACTLLASEDDLMTLDKSLKALEALGMNVGFLHARIQQLRSLVLDSESLMDKKKYEEACSQRDATEDGIKKLDAKLAILRRVSDAYTADIDTLKAKARNHELKFMKEVSAAW